MNLKGYETIELFNRYGVYIQEIGHRTVYETVENHLKTQPRMMSNFQGYNLDIFSFQSIEYLIAGRG